MNEFFEKLIIHCNGVGAAPTLRPDHYIVKR